LIRLLIFFGGITLVNKKINWCCNQKRGIQLIEQKPHLSEAYMKEADETIGNMLVSSKKWKVITGYYASYNALYSILMKAGIKSEIHECTIELMDLIEGFSKEDKDFLVTLKSDRIQVQYYLKEIELKDEITVKSFLLKCKSILNELNQQKIEKLRKMISDAQNA